MAKGKVALGLAGAHVHVVFHPRMKSSRGPGFRNLAPNNQPIQSRMFDSEGNPVEETTKGVQVAKGEFVSLTDEQVAAISATGTEVVEPLAIVPLETIDLAVNRMSYSVVPDDEVAGAFTKTADFYNWLSATEVAYVAKIVAGGGKDELTAIYADRGDLRAITIPFVATEQWPAVQVEYEKDTSKGKKIGAMVEEVYGELIGEFDVSEVKSEWTENHAKVVEDALSGKPAPKPAKVEEEPDSTGDLMAAMEAGVKAAKPKPKKKAPAKAKAKT